MTAAEELCYCDNMGGIVEGGEWGDMVESYTYKPMWLKVTIKIRKKT